MDWDGPVSPRQARYVHQIRKIRDDLLFFGVNGAQDILGFLLDEYVEIMYLECVAIPVS